MDLHVHFFIYMGPRPPPPPLDTRSTKVHNDVSNNQAGIVAHRDDGPHKTEGHLSLHQEQRSIQIGNSFLVVGLPRVQYDHHYHLTLQVILYSPTDSLQRLVNIKSSQR